METPTPIFLPGKFYGQRSLVGYSPWGHKESDMTQHMYIPLSLLIKHPRRHGKHKAEKKKNPACPPEQLKQCIPSKILRFLQGPFHQTNKPISYFSRIPRILSFLPSSKLFALSLSPKQKDSCRTYLFFVKFHQD